jgi:sn-glycerol 3-phosphate transport system substrate-binding protein
MKRSENQGGIIVKKFFVILLIVSLLVTLGTAKTKIQFWHAMSGWRIELLQNMANDFMEQNPDIEVEVQYTGSYQDTLNKLIAAIKAGTPPNVVQVFEVGTQSIIDGGIAVPMQDMIDKDPSFDIAALLPQVLNYYVVNGKLYSMPFNSSNAIMFYNKTMFEEAGLDPTKPPATYEELMEACKALTKKDANGNIIKSGITWNLHSWFFEQMLALQDAPLVNNNNGRTAPPTKALLNNEAGLKFVKLWKELSDNDYMVNTKKEDWTGARKLFLSQSVGMLITSTSDVSAIMDGAKENGFDVSAAFLPTPADSPQGGIVIGGGSLWMIDGNPDDEMEATWEFVKFMSETKQQIAWHKGTGYFPVRKDAITQLLNEGYYSEYPDHMVAILQLLFSKQNYNTNGAIMGIFPEFRNTFEDNIEKMLNGRMTPEQVLENTEETATELLEEYNELY